MIFRRISYAIALQFTAFVFVLLLITGAIFLTGDEAQRRRDAEIRLERQLIQILDRPNGARSIPELPRFQRERIRIVDSLGKTLFAGALFQDVPFKWTRRLTTIDIEGEKYDVLTAPYVEGGSVIGYLQVADRSPIDAFRARVYLFILVSVGLSALTFAVGLFFARRSLKPAEQMMERLEQFTQDASHELRTPLTAVGTSIDLALSTADNRELLTSAKRDLKGIATLVERLLELARLDVFALRKETVDASGLALAVLDSHAHEATERGVTIERVIAPNVTVQGDASLMKQVVANLLSNAIKFTDKGGRVSVTLTNNTLIIRDTGRGISPEALPKIFDRFYQEDDSRTKKSAGLGLGLALTKRIVDLHGWKMQVASEKGKGTTFIVKF